MPWITCAEHGRQEVEDAAKDECPACMGMPELDDDEDDDEIDEFDGEEDEVEDEDEED